MLESLNEEGLAPGVGLMLHPLKDIEVFTYVREGALTHEEPSGKTSVSLPRYVNLSNINSTRSRSRL